MGKKVSTVVGVLIVLVVAAVAAYLIIKFTSPRPPVQRPSGAGVPGASTTAPSDEGRRREPETRTEPRGSRREQMQKERRGEQAEPGSESSKTAEPQ